jgi:murein L,D-transpeptidase YcbB/YkuD
MHHYTKNKSLPVSILFVLIAFTFSCLLSFSSCKEKSRPEERVIVKESLQMDAVVNGLIEKAISYSISNKGRLDDSTILYQPGLLLELYSERKYSPVWSSTEKWLAPGDSILRFIHSAKQYGLFPEDYHSNPLTDIENIFSTGKQRNDAALWARADLLITDAVLSMMHDVKLGRLPADSITLRKDSFLTKGAVLANFNDIISGKNPDSVFARLEPKHKGYHDLKAALKKFLDSADFTPVISISYPNKNYGQLKNEVVQKFFEKKYLDSADMQSDSSQLAVVLKRYQKDNKLTVDGKIGQQTVRMLNLSDKEKFFRIAITLDRYKMLPEKMPEKYIWVNIPAYVLRFYNNDTVIISSRVVVGKQMTRTPVLTSAISEMITYPQWNIPQSIIVKEILPAMKKNPAYLGKKGYSLLNAKNEEIDPFSVDWSKYSKGVPYRIIQGSGDANALGVLKFNFNNKYAVYLHDTNQRSFFGMDSRALSHGCVRVQEWEKIAYFILENDNRAAVKSKQKTVTADSLTHWLKVKEKHSIPIKARVPVFIRYFTCEANNGRLSFFEDIYDEDKQMTALLFANKMKS